MVAVVSSSSGGAIALAAAAAAAASYLASSKDVHKPLSDIVRMYNKVVQIYIPSCSFEAREVS